MVYQCNLLISEVGGQCLLITFVSLMWAVLHVTFEWSINVILYIAFVIFLYSFKITGKSQYTLFPHKIVPLQNLLSPFSYSGLKEK